MKKHIKKLAILVVLIGVSLTGVSQNFKRVGDYYEGLAVAQQYNPEKGLSNQFGYVGKSNKLVIPMKYSYAGDFNFGSAVVGKDDKFGLINKKGKVILPIKFDEVRILCINEGGDGIEVKSPFYSVSNEGLRGVVNKNGKFLIPCKFEQVRIDSKIIEGKCFFVADGVVYNMYGVPLLPEGYSLLEGNDVEKNGLCVVENNGQYGLFDLTKKKEILNVEYDTVIKQGKCFVVKKDGMYGLVGHDGFGIYPSMFKEIVDFDGNGMVILVEENDGFGCYDTELQKEVLPVRCKGDYRDSIIMCEDKYRLWGGFWANDQLYDTIVPVPSFRRHEGYLFYPFGAYILKHDGNFGLQKCQESHELEEVLPFEYDLIELEWKGEEGTNSLIHCMKDGKWGVYEENGLTDLVSDVRMEEEVEKNGWVLLGQSQGKYGLYKPNYETRFVYDEKPIKWGYKWLVRIKGKYGIESNDDMNYEELPPIYDTIMVEKGTELLAFTMKEGEMGWVYYNPYGQKCVGPLDWPYEDIRFGGNVFDDDLGLTISVYVVKKKGKWGYIKIDDSRGQVDINEISRPQFDKVSVYDTEGKALVKKGQRTYYIDKFGKKLKRKIYFK